MTSASGLDLGPFAPLAENLQTITEALAATTTQREVIEIVLTPAVQALGASAGIVLLVDQTDQQLKIAGSQGYGDGTPTVWQEGPVVDHALVSDILRMQEARYFEHAGALKEAYPDLESRTGGLATVANATLPMFLDHRPLGVIVLDFTEPHQFTPAERRFLTILSAQCAVALGRAMATVRLEARVEERTRALQLSNQRLQEANEELEAFTYSASHDLRTPVRHVMGFAELAENAVSKGQYEKVGPSLEMVKKGAQRMNALIDGMLVLSRSGRQPLQVQPVDLNTLVTLARRDTTDEFGAHPVRWQMGHLPTVQGDAQLLQQVMTNLLSNAVKYSVKREVSEISVSARSSATEWTISVQDNGVGFPPDYAGKLFGIFQRLHTEKDFKGVGVGLATVRRIVQKHGGQVFARSDGQTGATFRFTLPKTAE